MFIIRWFVNIISFIGFILAGTLLYFSFYPLKTSQAANINLRNTLNCEEKYILENKSTITQEDTDQVKQIIGQSVPVEIINDFSQNLDKLSEKLGSSANLTVSYCSLDDNLNPISNLQGYFDQKNKNYYYGSLSDIVTKLNNVPYLQVSSSNLNIKIPSVLVKTSYCSEPIHKSKFYFFAEVDSTQKNIALIQIDLIENKNKTTKNKMISNLLDTGHYIKSELYCK